jgi:hypothetical protein
MRAVMKRIVAFFALLGPLTASVARAEDVPSSRQGAVYAVGVGAAWMLRQDYASRLFHRFYPELSGYRYDNLTGSLWLRTGLRGGYAWTQPDMTVSVQIQERDFMWGGELGLALNWYVVPILAVGAQQIVRKTTLEVAPPVTASRDRISGSETLNLGFVHAGVAFPVAGDLINIEPWGRWFYSPDDWRLKGSYGIEASVRIF